MESKVIYEKINKVGILKINRPDALNALNRKIVDDIDCILDQIEKDPDVKVLIIGSDVNFAAGADIKAMIDCNPEEALVFSFSSTFNKIDYLQIPTIAAIDGYALGGGLELALACDFRIASKTAKMGLPEITLGIMPGAGGTIRLPRIVGMSKALELILLGSIISAEQGEILGLINEVTEKENLMNTALEWAERLKSKPPVALKTAKYTIKKGLSVSNIEEAIKLEAECWASLFTTEDQKEGMKAFIDKRKPIFKGK